LKSLKKFSVLMMGLFLVLIVFVVGCGGSDTTADKQSGAPEAESPKAANEAVAYIAGMGGHIAKAEIEIDPTDENEPIKVKKLGKIRLGKADSWATHDVRIDHERGIAYSSAFVVNPEGKISIASIDLSDDKVIKDTTVPVSDRYTGGPLFCASGQSKDMWLPVVMGYEGWIDVIEKDTLELKHRVHLDHADIPKEYIWAHGVHTPDMKKFLLTISATSAEQTGKGLPRGAEDILFYMLDMDALLEGKIEILKKSAVKADPAASASLRQHFTNDGKYLLQTARDRLLVLDADTLELAFETKFDKEKGAQIELHDAIATQDDKYALLTLRMPVKAAEGEDGKPVMDGMLMLYDIENKKTIGQGVSVCMSCHADMSDLKDTSAVLCGIDVAWKN